MPEGPKIRRMVDEIAAAVSGRTAVAVQFAFERLKAFEATLSGRRVLGVEARGKAVLVHFDARSDDGRWCVYSHNQLYGKWLIGEPDTAPKTNRQLRFAIIGEARAARLYSASDIRVLRPDALDRIDYIARLGPDLLNAKVDDASLEARLDDKRFARRALGNLLLDQGFIAGIGNYLRSEILFESGLHPARKPRSLDDHERRCLIEAARRLIERAYRLRGITNDPERAALLKAEGKRFAARRYMVFARAGQRCYVCATPIAKKQVASRRLYLCPQCQPDSV